MMAAETSDAEVLQLLLVREMTRMQAEFLRATGWPAYFCASEMMVQAILMVVPEVTADKARETVNGFWQAFFADYSKKLAQAKAVPQLDGGVLPFVLRAPAPANDDANVQFPPGGQVARSSDSVDQSPKEGA